MSNINSYSQQSTSIEQPKAESTAFLVMKDAIIKHDTPIIEKNISSEISKEQQIEQGLNEYNKQVKNYKILVEKHQKYDKEGLYDKLDNIPSRQSVEILLERKKEQILDLKRLLTNETATLNTASKNDLSEQIEQNIPKTGTIFLLSKDQVRECLNSFKQGKPIEQFLSENRIHGHRYDNTSQLKENITNAMLSKQIITPAIDSTQKFNNNVTKTSSQTLEISKSLDDSRQNTSSLSGLKDSRSSIESKQNILSSSDLQNSSALNESKQNKVSSSGLEDSRSSIESKQNILSSSDLQDSITGHEKKGTKLENTALSNLNETHSNSRNMSNIRIDILPIESKQLLEAIKDKEQTKSEVIAAPKNDKSLPTRGNEPQNEGFIREDKSIFQPEFSSYLHSHQQTETYFNTEKAELGSDGFENYHVDWTDKNESDQVFEKVSSKNDNSKNFDGQRDSHHAETILQKNPQRNNVSNTGLSSPFNLYKRAISRSMAETEHREEKKRDLFMKDMEEQDLVKEFGKVPLSKRREMKNLAYQQMGIDKTSPELKIKIEVIRSNMMKTAPKDDIVNNKSKTGH